MATEDRSHPDYHLMWLSPQAVDLDAERKSDRAAQMDELTRKLVCVCPEADAPLRLLEEKAYPDPNSNPRLARNLTQNLFEGATFISRLGSLLRERDLQLLVGLP